MENAVVPRDNLLGKEGGGITNMMRNLEAERLTLAAISLGIADRCMDIMLRYSVERSSFGRPIHALGQIQRYIAESYAKTAAARALIYTVARTAGPTSETASAPMPPSSSRRRSARRSPTTLRCWAAGATATSSGRALPARRQAPGDRRRHPRGPEEPDQGSGAGGEQLGVRRAGRAAPATSPEGLAHVRGVVDALGQIGGLVAAAVFAIGALVRGGAGVTPWSPVQVRAWQVPPEQ